MEDILDNKIKEFCLKFENLCESYCGIRTNSRTVRSYSLNGCYLVYNPIACMVGVIREGAEHLYWYYYDEDLDRYDLPNTDFVKAVIEYITTLNLFETDEYKKVKELTKLLEDAEIGF